MLVPFSNAGAVKFIMYVRIVVLFFKVPVAKSECQKMQSIKVTKRSEKMSKQIVSFKYLKSIK